MKLEDWLSETYGHDKDSRKKWMELVYAWRTWFIGYNKQFHNYSIWNGKANVTMKRKSLQMAKKCCEDWANILFNVNCTVTVAGESDNDNLQKVLNQNSFWLLANQAIEKSWSVGTGALVQSIVNLEYNDITEQVHISGETRLAMEFVDAEKIYPLSWDAKSVTECAFVSYKNVKGKKYAVASVHLLDGDEYIIRNRIFGVKASGDIEELSAQEESDLLGAFSEFRTGSPYRWFCLLSPALANNILPPSESAYDYPFGISIYANAIDAIKCIDMAYDAIANEITIGRMRIFASEDMFEGVGDNSVFDASDISVYVLPKGLNSENLLQPVAPALRVASMQDALNADLAVFSNLVGMGKQMYDFNIANMATAAQVYSTNSELKRSRDKHKTKLENELYDFLLAVCYASTAFTNLPINPEGLTIGFDDTLFEDVDTTATRMMQEVDAQVASRVEYRMMTRKEDREAAEKAISEIDAESANSLSGQIGADI